MPPTAKSSKKPAYRCVECGWTAVKWVGRCGECQAWGTVEEAGTAQIRKVSVGSVSAAALPIGDVNAQGAVLTPTDIPELDRVLGGGMVQGAVVLLGGEPGIGKSTLLIDVASRAARRGVPVLYVTGEESMAQVKLRAERTDSMADSLYLASEHDLGAVLAHIENIQPQLLLVDSVQTIAAAEVEGSAGGVSQVRQVAATLIQEAKRRNMATFLVGHVTKDGSIAGPRVLEHLVDVVCQFEGDRHSRLRLVRAVKNRYGPTDEVGCFDLHDRGIEGLSDPSGIFLSHQGLDVSGTCISVTMEGRRPLLTEVQALVAGSALNNPRRATSGLDSARIAMLIAVLQRRVNINLMSSDVYVSTVGGARLSEPAADLTAALAIASASSDHPLPKGMIAFGEVGLAGELRPVTGMERRLTEAQRMGCKGAIIPAERGTTRKALKGFEVIEAETLQEAWALCRLSGTD